MIFLSALILGGVSTVRAQDVHFEFNGAGQTKAMTEWGVDTAWPSQDNMRQSLYHMRAAQVDVVRVNFFMHEPLDANGEIGPRSKALIDQQLLLAAMAGNKALALTPATGEQWDPNDPDSGPTHPHYLDGNGHAVPARWLALMEATQRYIGKPIRALEVFNEPDFWKGMGPPQKLRDILLLVQGSPYFQGTELHAASTLSSTEAQAWYDSVADLEALVVTTREAVPVRLKDLADVRIGAAVAARWTAISPVVRRRYATNWPPDWVSEFGWAARSPPSTRRQSACES